MRTGIAIVCIMISMWAEPSFAEEQSRDKQQDVNDKSSPMLKLVSSLTKVNARLSFVPEGLMATLDIERKKEMRF